MEGNLCILIVAPVFLILLNFVIIIIIIIIIIITFYVIKLIILRILRIFLCKQRSVFSETINQIKRFKFSDNAILARSTFTC